MQITRTITLRSDLGRQIQAAGERKVRAIAEQIVDDAARRANATFARDYETKSGAGAGSIYGRVEGSAFPITLVLTSDVEHVKILNAGSPPHIITPVNARFLQFQASVTGLSGTLSQASTNAPRRGTAKRFRRSGTDFGINKIVRTDRVQHPGVAPGRFMERALETAVRNALRR